MQDLPVSDPNLYDGNKIEFSIIDEIMSLEMVEKTLDQFCHEDKDSVANNFLKKAIMRCEVPKPFNIDIKTNLISKDLPFNLTPS